MDIQAACYSNNKFSRLSDTALPVSDLGIQRGYGIFDFLRVTGKKPLFLKDHLNRFFHSAMQMRLQVSKTSDELTEIILQLIHKNNFNHSGIRILLTGGDSDDGYTLGESRLSVVHQPLAVPPDQFPEKGIRLFSYPFQRQLPEVKTTDYIMAIWLQPWLKSQNGDEILYHTPESVLECPRSNVFMITKDHQLVTPESNVLKGITRKQILSLASELGIKTECRAISLEELMLADEVFISSSTKRLLPVSEINGKKIGNTSFRFSKLLWNAFCEAEHG